MICEKYSVDKKSVVTKSVVKKSVAIKIIHMQQDQNEIIREYYLRIHDVLVAIDDMNILLFSIIRHWINELNNEKLSRHMISRSIREQSLFDVCNTVERKLRQKKKRKRQKKKYQLILQHQLQNIVDRDVFYKFSSILKKQQFILKKINTAVNITNTLFLTKFIASNFTSSQSSSLESNIVNESSSILQKKSYQVLKNRSISSHFAFSSSFVSSSRVSKSWLIQNWRVSTLFEISVVNESLLILKKTSCDLSKINTNNLNNCDIESIDEILAFEFDKWIVVVAKKKIIDYINTFDETAKNSCAIDIEVSNNSFDWSRCCTVDDVRILNQKIFALIALYDAFLKNLFVENIKISIAMIMSSFKHLMNMNDSYIKTFAFDIVMNAFSKNCYELTCD